MRKRQAGSEDPPVALSAAVEKEIDAYLSVRPVDWVLDECIECVG